MAVALQYSSECLGSPRIHCIAANILMLITSSGILFCSVLGANGIISLSDATGPRNETTTNTTTERAIDGTTICISIAVLETINIVFGVVLLIIISKASPRARALRWWQLAWGSAQAQALALGLVQAAHALWERGPGEGAARGGGLLLALVAHRALMAATLIAATHALHTRLGGPQKLQNGQRTVSTPTTRSTTSPPMRTANHAASPPSDNSRLRDFDCRKHAFSLWNDDTGFGEARKETVRRAVPNSKALRVEIVPLWEERHHVGQCACCTGATNAL